MLSAGAEFFEFLSMRETLIKKGNLFEDSGKQTDVGGLTHLGSGRAPPGGCSACWPDS